jgi:hypothetical protein
VNGHNSLAEPPGSFQISPQPAISSMTPAAGAIPPARRSSVPNLKKALEGVAVEATKQ